MTDTTDPKMIVTPGIPNADEGTAKWSACSIDAKEPKLLVFHPLPAGDASQDTWTVCDIHQPGNGYWFCHDTESAAMFALQRVQDDPFYVGWDLYHNTKHIEGHGVDRYADLTFRMTMMLATANLNVIKNEDRVIDAAKRKASPPAHLQSLLSLVEEARANAQWWLARLVDAHVGAVHNKSASGTDIIKQSQESYTDFLNEGHIDV